MIKIVGLTSHPSRPFVMATCSRDSTVRIWSLTPLIQPVEINILAQRPWNEIIQAPGNLTLFKFLMLIFTLMSTQMSD